MKYGIIFLYLLFAQANIAMEKQQRYETQIDASWMISRITFKSDFYTLFSGLLTDEPEYAFAIEPFYYLQIYHADRFIRTSPIKAIKRLGDLFYIYTASGSVYHAQIKDQEKIKGPESLFALYDSPELPLYERRDLREIKNMIDMQQILPGENYKTWIPYRWKNGDENIFNLSNELNNLKHEEEILLDLSSDDLETWRLFP